MKNGLSRQQHEAVVAQGNLLIVAVPGSGKTTVLAQRAIHLIRHCKQDHVVAVTFTREAASEFRSRVQRLDFAAAKQITVGTFHALALQQLRRHPIKQTLLSPVDQQTIIRKVWRHAGQGLSLEQVRRSIEREKSKLQPQSPETAPLYSYYQDMLNRSNSIDFQDLLLHTVHGMQQGRIPTLPGQSLLVDEFQDTDSVQYAYIQAHAQHMDITIVADDDQTIYSWRQALGYPGLCRFESEYQAKRLYLDTNYRSCPEILHCAGKLIQNNKNRLVKELRAQQSGRGQVQTLLYSDYLDEALAIARQCKGAPTQTAVLSRVNRRLDLIERVLTSEHIPYYRVGGKGLWERRHIGVLLALLHSVLKGSNPGLQQALHYAGLGQTAIKRLYTLTKGRLIRICDQDFVHQHIAMTETQRKKFLFFAQALRAWQQQWLKGNTQMLLHAVTDWLCQQASSDRQKEDLLLATDALAAMHGKLPARLVKANTLCKNTCREGVALMTLHSAKGLEFDHTWMMAMEENILPHAETSVEEERRLCYVGVTRARKKLFLSATTKHNPLSRFIEEMGLTAEPGFSITSDTDGYNANSLHHQRHACRAFELSANKSSLCLARANDFSACMIASFRLA